MTGKLSTASLFVSQYSFNKSELSAMLHASMLGTLLQKMLDI